MSTVPRETGQPADAAPSREAGHEFLSLAEAAAYLGCNERSIRRWVKRSKGALRCYRLGNRLRFRRADLVSWLSGANHGPTA